MTVTATVKIISALLILPLIYVGWLALSYGIADRYAYDAKQIEKSWGEKDGFNRETLQTAIDKTETALNWHPNHPDYLDRSARLLLLDHIYTKNRATVELARTRLMTSRIIRPGWPGNWAVYLDLKDRMKESDQGLSNAIIESARIGPWEPSTLQAVTRVGVANYKSLSVTAKRAVDQSIQNGLDSRVPGLPNAINKLITQEADNWTLELTQSMIEILTTGDWSPSSTGAKTALSLTLWPLANSLEKHVMVVNIAGAVTNHRGDSLLRQVRAAGKLHLLCPRLPRMARFDRQCRKVHSSK